ncbi:MAG TPA: hypothetical protein VF215_17885 [Thermoanaerobaculia bacterium]
MPDTNDRVMAMIEKEIQANPEISNEDLRAKAEKLDDAVARMSARQFNARYPLQVKRRMRPRKRGGRKAAKSTATKKRGRPAGSGRKRGRPAKAAARGRAAAVAGGASIGPARGRPARGGAGDGSRGRVRAALLDFARDLASADGAGLVDVIAGVDGYVERVMKAVR